MREPAPFRSRAPKRLLCARLGAGALDGAWALWSRGEARCDRGGALALAVRATPKNDASSALYRLVCVACGCASPWFAVHAGRVSVVAEAPTSPSLPTTDEPEESLLEAFAYRFELA